MRWTMTVNRKQFLQSLVGASALISSPMRAFSAADTEVTEQALDSVARNVNGSATGLTADAIETVRIGLIGAGNRGNTLSQMLTWLIEHDRAELVAVSDLRQHKADALIEQMPVSKGNKPSTYCKDEHDWKNLVKRDDLDLILIATPWALHTPMCLEAMNHGKHVACEVPIAYTIDDCWALIETAEQTRKHCIMIENCCYNDEELWVLNMVENGVFGDLTHAEGAYIHDLRKHLLSETYYENQWRIEHHKSRDGNFYTTHGLGPISQYLGIGRGDNFSHLTSMSSRERALSETARKVQSPHTSIRCGDMNTTLIRTHQGKTVMMQFDVHTGSPYSRLNKLVGTDAVHQGYPSRLYIDDKNELHFSGHRWLTEEQYREYRDRYRHPMINTLKRISENYRQGHGGMDFVMMYRLVTCLNLGVALDHNVYDGVIWSAVTPLSELSVAHGSQRMKVPDFTAGRWQQARQHEVMRTLDDPVLV